VTGCAAPDHAAAGPRPYQSASTAHGLRGDDAAERDPEGVLPARLEGALFAALDGEGDARIAAQLQAALRTLLRAGAGAAPSRWLAACTRVALAAPDRAPAGAGPGGATGAGGAQEVRSARLHTARFRGLGSGGTGCAGRACTWVRGAWSAAACLQRLRIHRCMHRRCSRPWKNPEGVSPAARAAQEADADEEGSLGSAGGAPTAAAPQASPQTPAAAAGGAPHAAPRLRTRLFAARCALELLGAVGGDGRHWDAAAAAAEPGGDWLVSQLPALVDAGFRMATGQARGRRRARHARRLRVARRATRGGGCGACSAR